MVRIIINTFHRKGICTSMAQTEQQIRDVYDRYVTAIRAQDFDAMMSLYTDDTHVYDAMAQWEYSGAESWKTNVEHWFGHEGMEQGVEIENLEITVAGDVAIVRMDVQYSATTETETHGMWNRMSSALRSTNGEWKIFQEHASLPINPETLKPIFERPS